MNTHFKYYDVDGYFSSINSLPDLTDYYLVMEGDDGGQIYITCPASILHCSDEILKKILTIIDDHEWPGNYDDMKAYFFHKYLDNNIIPGGMGGGVAVKNDLWIHERLKHIKPLLLDIITNQHSISEYNNMLNDLQNALSNSNN